MGWLFPRGNDKEILSRQKDSQLVSQQRNTAEWKIPNEIETKSLPWSLCPEDLTSHANRRGSLKIGVVKKILHVFADELSWRNSMPCVLTI